MLKLKERLTNYKNSIIDYQLNKPLEFQIFQIFFIIAAVIIAVAFFLAIDKKFGVDKVNERANDLIQEMNKIHESNIIELKKERQAIETERMKFEIQIQKENDEKKELSNNGKNLEKNEKIKLEEIELLKKNNDLRGYSNELVKNLGY
jgi:hypothetical protein